jgi:hypothetical protein
MDIQHRHIRRAGGASQISHATENATRGAARTRIEKPNAGKKQGFFRSRIETGVGLTMPK